MQRFYAQVPREFWHGILTLTGVILLDILPGLIIGGLLDAPPHLQGEPAKDIGICLPGFGPFSQLVDGRFDGLRDSVSKVDEHAQRTRTSDLAIPFVDGAVVAAGGGDVGVDDHVEGGLGLAFVEVVDEDAEPRQPGINRGLEGTPSSLLGHA